MSGVANPKTVKRVTMELAQIMKMGGVCGITNLEAAEDNVLEWTALALPPEATPYGSGAFQLKIIFPPEYPFKPPTVTFVTPIYHPNVSEEEGLICMEIVNAAHWKPTTKIVMVLEQLVKMLVEPEPGHPVRADLAEIFTKDRTQFDKLGAEHTKANAVERPAQ